MQNQKLEPTGVAKTGPTRGLQGRGPGLAHHWVAGQVLGWV
jgi:hypothetical protein